jgi:hypothetical protein
MNVDFSPPLIRIQCHPEGDHLLIWRKLRSTFFGEEFNMSAEKQNLTRERINLGCGIRMGKKDVVYVKLDSDNP